MTGEMFYWGNPFPPKVGDVLSGEVLRYAFPEEPNIKIRITGVVLCNDKSQCTGINGIAFEVFFERVV